MVSVCVHDVCMCALCLYVCMVFVCVHCVCGVVTVCNSYMREKQGLCMYVCMLCMYAYTGGKTKLMYVCMYLKSRIAKHIYMPGKARLNIIHMRS